MAETVEFDVLSMTLGEALAVEAASGQDFTKLTATRMGQLTAAVFVSRLRNEGRAPSWPELLSLRLLDASALTSPSDSDGPSET